ncbi:MAG: hypothetical protein AAF495_12660 [Pseudomonadota bacterium]
MKTRKDSDKAGDPSTAGPAGAAAATVLSVLTLKKLDDQVDALVARLSEDVEARDRILTVSRPKPSDRSEPS